jgi:hydroxymethylpyrimidine pyrophosphatase-like HAD family hydrolase
MKPLPPPASVCRILSFDFDGTLHHPADDPPVPAVFFDLLEKLRDAHGAIWCINTGRSLPQMIEGFVESRFPFLPDWVVAREREIYRPNAFGRMVPHAEWNARCDKEMHRLFKKSAHFLKTARHDILEHTGAEWIAMDGEPAGIISRTEEEMDWIATRLTALDPPEKLGWQRNSIYLRFGHRGFQKGSSLAEITRLHALDATGCFAIGDSHNDLEMLDPAHAAFIACPANAVPEVRAKVARHGGHLASRPHGAGVVEALRACFAI